MKICYIVDHFPPHIGGAEILFQDYAKEMARHGHEVRVVTSSSGGISGKYTRDGVDIYYYDWKIIFGHPIPRRKDMEGHVEWADIVHTTILTVANPARELCEKYKKPSIVTIHEVLGDKWNWIERNRVKASAFRLFERYVCCKPYDYVHVVSDATLKDYIKYYGHRENIIRIYNSVDHNILELPGQSSADFNKYFGLSGDFRRFLYFGRPGQGKGILVYIKAIALLKEKYGRELLTGCRFCFVISDDPPAPKKKFLRLIRENHLEDCVLVRPSMARADLFKIISQADYVVVPSITEGFGYTAAESCLMGKKVLYSDGGSLPEVVSGSVLAFKNRDSLDLAEKIYQIIDKGEAAFGNVPFKDFRKEDMVGQLELLYRQIQAENKGAH